MLIVDAFWGLECQMAGWVDFDSRLIWGSLKPSKDKHEADAVNTNRHTNKFLTKSESSCQREKAVIEVEQR